MRTLILCLPLVTVLACDGAAPEHGSAPADDPAAAPACDLAIDTLPGRTFVLAKDADISARVRFRKDGDTLKAVYNGKSLINMYNYTCAPSAEGADCWEDAPKADLFCK